MAAIKFLSVAAFISSAIAAPVTKRDTIPSFVLDYAPIVYLDTSETYFPTPLTFHLEHVTPSAQGGPNPPTLDNLSQLNALGGSNVSLNSKDDFTTYPAWLHGTAPDSVGKVADDPSSAIIVNDYKNGTVYAYYMYFYSFNLGNKPWALGRYAGNHVGDWEHNAIKFVNGSPESVWYSQHSGGQAFTYAATEKSGLRPVSYSAYGSHANYAQAGTHDHTIAGQNLPFTLLLSDKTSKGPMWDLTKNSYLYSYNGAANSFTAYDGISPTSWLNYQGIWGDKQLPSSDSRQKELLGIDVTALWTGGPTGPDDKQLNRPWICADSKCPIYSSLRARGEETV